MVCGIQSAEIQMGKQYIKGSFHQWRPQKMIHNENTKEFEYVTYLPPGPQQFFFVENHRFNDKRVRNIIIKPR